MKYFIYNPSRTKMYGSSCRSRHCICNHLLFLLLGFFALCSNVFLAMIIELGVLLCLHHLLLPAVILQRQLSGTGDLLKQSCTLLGILHCNGLHSSLEGRRGRNQIVITNGKLPTPSYGPLLQVAMLHLKHWWLDVIESILSIQIKHLLNITTKALNCLTANFSK